MSVDELQAVRAADWCGRTIVHGTVGCTDPPGWLRESYASFHETVTDPAYPCYFGGMAERRGDLFYASVDGEDGSELRLALTAFRNLTRRPDARGRRHNLVVFFKPDATLRTHDEYRGRMWRTLQFLHDHDPQPALNVGPSDPSDPMWEFPFMGMRLFVVGVAPSYVRRRSRNLGPGLVMIFQPREVFADPATGEPIGTQARETIRRRVRNWDGVDAHPDLGVYSDANNWEWTQYFLSDDGQREKRRCPFLARQPRVGNV